MKSKDIYKRLFEKYDALQVTTAIEKMGALTKELCIFLRNSTIKEPMQFDIEDITNIDKNKGSYSNSTRFISPTDMENLKTQLVENEIMIDQLKQYFGISGREFTRLKARKLQKTATVNNMEAEDNEK
ncbi:MAG: hypothetical protein LBV51_03510 [Acholeplasmatales bacterium]|jgi:hypothetical protein|nr:hypothetical protein [Acholeplasmatales bacterium]